MLLFGIVFYIRCFRVVYIMIMVIYFFLMLFVFLNVIYYWEFMDFIMINMILGVGKVVSGLGESVIWLFCLYDVIYWIDFIILIVLLIVKKIKLDFCLIWVRMVFVIFILVVMIFLGNFFMVEVDCLELLICIFFWDYLVKYFGLNVFMVYDGV